MSRVLRIDSDNIIIGRDLMNGNSNLVEWKSPLSKLVDGERMFNECSGLSFFNGDLSSLKTAENMFNGCSLDCDSIASIADTISDFSEVDFVDDAPWVYDIEGNLITIPSEKRGRITINVNEGLLTDYDYIKTVNPFLQKIHQKNWRLDRNIPFYYNKSFKIVFKRLIRSSLIKRFETKLIAIFNFKFLRSQGKTVIPSVTISKNDNNIIDKQIFSTIFQNDFTPDSVDNDDGSASANFDFKCIDDTDDALYNVVFNFALKSSGTDLQLKFNDNSINWRVLIYDIDTPIYYDISEETGYCPDAEGWNTEVYVPNNLTITYITEDGTMMNSNAKVGTIELDKLETAPYVFYNVNTLTSCTCDFPELINGQGMFAECTNLTTYTGNLSKLQNGELMFMNCNLSEFNCNLSYLIKASQMFHNCKNLTTFNGSLDSLTCDDLLFDGCTSLQTVTIDNMGNMRDASSMFTNLESLKAVTIRNMDNLLSAREMFSGCKVIDLETIKNMSENLPNISSLNRNIDSHWTYTDSDGNQQVIEKERRGIICLRAKLRDNVADYTNEIKTIQPYLDKILEKGWYIDRNDDERVVGYDVYGYWDYYCPVYALPFHYQCKFKLTIVLKGKTYYDGYITLDIYRFQGYGLSKLRSGGSKGRGEIYWSSDTNPNVNLLEWLYYTPPSDYQQIKPTNGFYNWQSSKSWDESKTYQDDGSCQGDFDVRVGILNTDLRFTLSLKTTKREVTSLTVKSSTDDKGRAHTVTVELVK